MSITRLCPLIAVVVLTAAQGGCASKPKAPPEPPQIPTIDVLEMTVRTGGVHHRLLYHADHWYQSYDSRVMVVDPKSGFTVHQVDFGRPGDSPPVVDMLIHGESLFVVLQADRVIRLTLDDPAKPAIAEILDTSVLGVRPFELSVAGGTLFASGEGGVLDLHARTLVSRSDNRAGPVATTAEGLATTIERNAVRLNDGAMIGAATSLISIPKSFELGDHLIGVRQRDTGAIISLMNGNVREVQTEDSSIAVSGKVAAIRFFDNKMWVVNDDAIRECSLSTEGIVIDRTISVLGARDVARRDDNHLLVSGVFGRAVYREEENDDGPGDEFDVVHREPSGLHNAVTDRRYILAGGPLGHWRYLIGQPIAELNERRITQQQKPQRSAQTPVATAKISDDNTVLEVEVAGVKWQHREPGGTRLHSVNAMEDRFWVGHDRGITVLNARPPAPVVEGQAPSPIQPERIFGRLRFEGPVRFIYPLATGRGGVFVSEFGGFGVAEIEKKPIDPASIQLPPRR